MEGLVIIERPVPSASTKNAQEMACLTAALGVLEGRVTTIGKSRRKYRSRLSRSWYQQHQDLLDQAGFIIVWSN